MEIQVNYYCNNTVIKILFLIICSTFASDLTFISQQPHQVDNSSQIIKNVLILQLKFQKFPQEPTPRIPKRLTTGTQKSGLPGTKFQALPMCCRLKVMLNASFKALFS